LASNNVLLYPSAKKIATLNNAGSHTTDVSSHATAVGGTTSVSSSSKVGRNLLGKKLHAAGVALLMGSNSSCGSLEDALKNSCGDGAGTSTSVGDWAETTTKATTTKATATGNIPSSAHSVGDALDSLAGLLPHRSHHHHHNTNNNTSGDLANGGLKLTPRAASAGDQSNSQHTPREYYDRPGIAALEDFGLLTLEDVRRDNYSISSEHSPRLAEYVPPTYVSPIKSIRSPTKQSPGLTDLH
jgi:hypothetical protein